MYKVGDYVEFWCRSCQANTIGIINSIDRLYAYIHTPGHMVSGATVRVIDIIRQLPDSEKLKWLICSST